MSSELERRLEGRARRGSGTRSGSGGEGAPPGAARAPAGRPGAARAPHGRARLRGCRRPPRDRGRLARRGRRAARQLRREGEAASGDDAAHAAAGSERRRGDRRRAALGGHEGGFRLQGLPVTSAALSPRALYVAAGIGDSLVAMAPNGRTAWSHPAGGTVVAIAWAPDGLRIAYVVHAGTSLRPARHLRQRDRTTRRSTARCGRCGPRGGQTRSPSRTWAGRPRDRLRRRPREPACRRRAPAGHRPRVRAVGRRARAGGAERCRRSYEQSRLPARHRSARSRRSVGSNGRLAVAVPGSNTAVIHRFAPDGASRARPGRRGSSGRRPEARRRTAGTEARRRPHARS